MMTQAENDSVEQPIRVLSANFPPGAKRALDSVLLEELGFLPVGNLNLDLDTPEGNLRLLETITRLSGNGGELLIFVLFTSQRHPLPNIFKHVMQEYPDVRLLIFANDEALVSAYWMGLNEVALTGTQDTTPSDALRVGITYLRRANPQTPTLSVQHQADHDMI